MIFRIDVATAASTLPTPASAGTPGYFTAGNPGTGTPATVIDQDWMNGVQESLIDAVDQAGLTPTKGDVTQITQAMQILGRRRQPLTGSGTFTVPAGVHQILAVATGGGGGGSGCQSGATIPLVSGSGGGAGATEWSLVAVTPGGTVSYAVGAGGAGGVGAVAGSNGGNTTFGSLTAAGGAGGGVGAGPISPGGIGGTASSSGQSGGDGGDGQSSTFIFSAYGGGSFWGGSSRAYNGSSGSPPSPRASGSGGGGVYDTASSNTVYDGLPGAAGTIVLFY
jgi:hypothetical protein